VPDRGLASGSTGLSSSSDPLSRLGHAVLATDHRIVSGLYIAVLLLFVVIRTRSRCKPTLLDAIRVVLALVTIASGVVVSCVFLLTKPPAVEALSSDVLSLVGLLTIIVTFGFGGRELVTNFFPTSEQAPPTEP